MLTDELLVACINVNSPFVSVRKTPITNNSLQYISENCKNIQCLDVGRCINITHEGVKIYFISIF